MKLQPIEIQARLLTLEHVTTTLWANFLANTGGDTIATCDEVAATSLANLERIYERQERGTSENLHVLVQHIIHHEEYFWAQVREQVVKLDG